MAIIKLKKGAGTDPTGLTLAEPAWDYANRKLFVGVTASSIWVGAEVENTSLSTSNLKIPTSFVVKTYVDNQVAGGAVTSVSGITGAVLLQGGTGISITTSTGKGITIGVNTNVALLDTAQTFTALKTFSSGLAGAGGITFSNDIAISGVSFGVGSGNLNSNVAIGTSGLALPVNTSGASNIAIGSPSLQNNTTGNFNIALGAFSSQSGTTGSNNVAIGDNALRSNINGSLNVAIGSSALRSLQSGGGSDWGQFNTGVGADAGRYVGTGTAQNRGSTGSIFIGYQARSGVEFSTNEIVIGANALGFGSNTAVIGATLQSAAHIYGVLNALSGLTAPGATFNGNVNANNIIVRNQSGVSFGDADNSHWVALRAPSGVTTNVTFTLPGALGQAGNALLTDASGNLSWGAATALTATLTDAAETGVTQFLLFGTTGSNKSILLDQNTTPLSYRPSTGRLSIPGALEVIGDTIAGSAGNIITFSSTDTFFAKNINTNTGDLNVGGNATVTGNLTVNGTTTYVNSTVTEIADPIITLGWTGAIAAMPIDDNKDRGVAFKYNSGGGRTGFFGFDDSGQVFTYVPQATITGEVISGVAGDATFRSLFLTNQANNFDGANRGGLTADTLSAARTYTFPDHSGRVVVPSDLGTSGFILRSAGTSSQPTWVNPNIAGFTAYMAQEIAGGAAGNLLYQSTADNTAFVTSAGTTGFFLTYNTASNTPIWANPNLAGFTAFTSTNNLMAEDTTDGTAYLTFVNDASATNQGLKYRSTLTYNAITNFVEANIDGGSY